MPSHQLHQNGQELTLFPLKTLESGTLTCTAVNAFGVDRASVAVVIKNRMYHSSDSLDFLVPFLCY